MENQNSRGDLDSAAPSDADFDALYAKMERERNSAMAKAAGSTNELDADDDELTDDTDHTDEAPKTDIFEDDDDVDEVNTPKRSSNQNDKSDLHKDSTEKPKKVLKSTLVETSEDTDDDEEARPSRLSRKERGTLIAELRAEVEEGNRKLAAQAAAQAALTAENERLDKEIQRALGTDEEYEKSEDDALAGDDDAAEKRRIWKANRKFYQKLVAKAERDVQMAFTQQYWATIENLPGVDRDIVANEPKLSLVLKHIYEAGSGNNKEEYENTISELKDDIETWKTRYKNLKTNKAGVGKRSPTLDGGTPVDGEGSDWDWKKRFIDPKTGLFTDEADSIVARFGVKALKDKKYAMRG